MAEVSHTISASLSGKRGNFMLDVAFETPARGITALFGPSGCGKTTVLRCMAGLDRLSGHLFVGGDVWQDDARRTFRPPHQRAVGYVFQEASLFSHLSVRANLVYGQRRAMRRADAETIRLDDVVDILGLGRLLDRATDTLSGGERQRIAVGRALLSQPRLLLMDEPLSALDHMTREEILPYFEALHTALAIPVVYVSHDISEIERLADHMVLLLAGRVAASGPLATVLADSSLPIARAPDAATVFETEVGAFHAQDGLSELTIDGLTLLVPGRIGAKGDRHRIRIAASNVSLVIEKPSLTTILNVLPVRIHAIESLGEAQANIVVTLGHRDGGAKLLVRATHRALRLLNLRAGQDVYAQLKAASLVAHARPLS